VRAGADVASCEGLVVGGDLGVSVRRERATFGSMTEHGGGSDAEGRRNGAL
jgi:hypothetical protein